MNEEKIAKNMEMASGILNDVNQKIFQDMIMDEEANLIKCCMYLLYSDATVTFNRLLQLGMSPSEAVGEAKKSLEKLLEDRGEDVALKDFLDLCEKGVIHNDSSN